MWMFQLNPGRCINALQGYIGGVGGEGDTPGH